MTAEAELESVNEGQKFDPKPATGLVYVMTNQETGNAVTVLERAADGALTQLETFPTGGLGVGDATDPDAILDPLMSQGSLVLSDDRRFLFAVNAGSNEISVLAVKGKKLVAVDRVSSGGLRPVSVTVHKHLLYVVHSTDGTITGFTVSTHGKLAALAGSTQTLIGGPDPNSPSQVEFTPNGKQLVVTEKNTDVIDIFAVDPHGRARPPVGNTSNGGGPFGFTFAGKDLLIVSELSGTTSSYRVIGDGMLKVVSGSVPTNQSASCWVVTNSATNPRYAYVSNAGSGSISGYRIASDGALSLLDLGGRTGVIPDPLIPIDSVASSDGRFLYVLSSHFDGTIETAITAFRIENDGSLTTIPGPGGFLPGTQGITAT